MMTGMTIFLTVTYVCFLLLFKNYTFHAILVSRAVIFLFSLLLILFLVKLLQSIVKERGKENFPVFKHAFRAGWLLALGGLLLSVNTRQSYERMLCEGQTLRLHGLSLTLRGVTVHENPGGVFLSKSVQARLESNGAHTTIHLFPPKKISGFFTQTTGFGFAPHVDIRNAEGNVLFSGYVLLGSFSERKTEALLPAKQKAPQVMMGVGYFPPKIEGAFKLPGSPVHFYVKIVSGNIKGKRYAFKGADYYVPLMKGRLESPQYYLGIFNGKKTLYLGPAETNRKIPFKGGTITLSEKLRYIVGIKVAHDYGINVLLTGLFFMLSGSVLQLAHILKRTQTNKAKGPTHEPS